ncbi:unnamed protein product [Penicillium salamii]|nr:unnamed protein product [Penicillium salamii]CAG8327746.1 unnamed protein product [Penicillium salamii]
MILSEKLCPGPDSGDRESKQITGNFEHQAVSLESPVASLDSRSVSHDGESESIDLTPWFVHYNRCALHFTNYGQFAPVVQSLAALMNIRLPYQRLSHPVETSMSPGSTTPSQFAPLRQYIRRLIITAQDSPANLWNFFGDAWEAGLSCILKEERANYLFTAKSSGWASTKIAYDILPDEQTPFLRPLRNPSEDEIQTAEVQWSEWLAMEDWMIGARTPW